MKHSLLFFLFTLVCGGLSAQLTNNGATIVIEQGATLTVEGALTNSSGTINNAGTLEVERNFTNNASLIATGNQSVVAFIGSFNSNFNPNGAPIRRLEVRKTNAQVDLTGDVTVTEELSFTGGNNTRLDINNSDLFLGAATTVTGGASNRFISTTGTGFVEKALPASQFSLPLGSTTNKILTMNVNGLLYVPGANIRVRHREGPAPDLPADATDYLTYHNEIVASGIAAYSNAVRSNYGFSSVVGDITKVEGASYSSGQWSYDDADRQTSFFTGEVTGTITAGTAFFTGTNFYGQVDPQVYLQGSYINGANMMRTNLSDAGLIPLASPYSDAPATAPSIPTGAVDWVKVELRNAVFPATVESVRSGFLMSDGSIVAPDGSSFLSFKDAPKSAFVAIYHRNHLPIRTSAVFTTDNAPFVDLTNGANVYSNPSVTGNAPTKALSGGVAGMWSGDANGSGNVSYNGGGNDRTSILLRVGFATSNNTTSGYFNEDINLDGNTIYNGGGSDRTSVLLNVGFATPTKVIQSHID
ncbi:hypothetical protein [Lewinella sp. 4G2]|uniref:hypothetical protein n=1 Tax=Lewinella sp. 4G2 TaxID=1803372 RepID=UPI0007B4B1CC|nr:hypothetical protein [Lewinella sp. 4G2]OAV43653.1 hypothetical protein A3850_003690 [Lewinella sp. 4G2]